MGFYAGTNIWRDVIYQLETSDPVVGGTVSWRGDYPTSGFSNAPIQNLADRTTFLKGEVDELLVEVGKGILSEVEHENTDSIEIVGDGSRENPLRANIRSALDSIAWTRGNNTYTKNNLFRGLTEVEDPLTSRGAVNKRTLEAGLGAKADKTYVDEGLLEAKDHQSLNNRNKPNAHDASAIGFRQEGEGAVERSVKAKLSEWIHVRDYGVKGDGSDETEKLRNAHTAANALGVLVSYVGIGQVSVQADARININTDVDFSRCTLRLLDGYVPVTEYTDNRNVLFEVKDPFAPTTTINLEGNLIPAQCYKGSVSFLSAGDNGYYRSVFPEFRVPWRDNTNTRAIHFPFYIENGQSNVPLFEDLREKTAGATAVFRPNSSKGIDLKGLSVDLNGANLQSVFQIERNEVSLDLVLDKETIDQNSCCSIVKIVDAGNITIRELRGPGMDRGTVASYCLHVSGGSFIRVSKMWGAGGESQMGTNRVSDFELRDSQIHRFDVHEDGFNMRAFDCVFQAQIQYGCGGGDWVFERISIVAKPNQFTYFILRPRGDYGRVFYGNIRCKDFSVTVPDNCWVHVFYFGELGSDHVEVKMPGILTMDGLVINLVDMGSSEPTKVIQLYEYTQSSGYIHAPTITEIKNVHINCNKPVKAVVNINPASTVRPSDIGAKILIEDIKSTSLLELEVRSPNREHFQGGRKWVDLELRRFAESVALTVIWEDLVIRTLRISEVKKLVNFKANRWPRRIEVVDSVIDYLGTVDKAFGPVSKYRAYTNILRDCVIYGDPNLSLMNAISGTLVRKYMDDGETEITDKPILPAGASLETIFTGWFDPAAYN